MEDMIWTDELAVGVEAFDFEHREMITLLNRVNHLLAMGRKEEILEHALHAFINYTRFHFTHAEGILERFSWGGLDDHRGEHEKLLAQVTEYYQRCKKGDIELSDEELYFLKHWLIDHIRDTDVKYKDFLADKAF